MACRLINAVGELDLGSLAPIFIERNAYKVFSSEVDTLSAKDGSRANSFSTASVVVECRQSARRVLPHDRAGFVATRDIHRATAGIHVASSAKSRTEPLASSILANVAF